MKKIFIHQIFYNEATKAQIIPGFAPMDNSLNERPDWREYWPIRNYLINNTLDENSLYGFFSPKFFSKTGLSSAVCYEFINSQSNEVDVFSFSPMYDLGAYFKNSFLQCITQEPASADCIRGAFNMLSSPIEIDSLIMHSGNNIFCNFFVAKPKFWRAWFEKCEIIWANAESNNTAIARGLNSFAATHDSPAAIKTFVIERVASLLLATNTSWVVRAYNPFLLPFSNSTLSRERSAMMQMDALKIAYVAQHRKEYLSLFDDVANLVRKKLS